MWNDGSAMRLASSAGSVPGSSTSVVEPVANGAAPCARRGSEALSVLPAPQALSSAAAHSVNAGSATEEGLIRVKYSCFIICLGAAILYPYGNYRTLFRQNKLGNVSRISIQPACRIPTRFGSRSCHTVYTRSTSMTATIFDSHKYAKRLMDAGVPAQVADVQAETMVEVMDQVATFPGKLDTQNSKIDHLDAKIDVLAAKIDLQAEKIDLQAGKIDVQAEKIDAMEAKFDEKINTVTAKFDAKIADAKAELIRWMVSLSVLQLALISALLLKLTH
jgi:hypothetical protein